MKQFDISYGRLILLLLPSFLRRDAVIAFLRVMTLPVITLYNRFTTKRNDHLYRLRMNGQVCYLRHLLNGAFPSADGRIRIEDGQAIGQWRFAWDECFDPYASYLLINETGTLFWDTDTILEGVNNFRVILPAVFMENKNDVDKIKSLINEYKLLSKSYSINYE